MASWQSALGGAGGGALTGAGIGAAFGPIGAGIGAGLGLISGGLSGYFGGGQNPQTGQEESGLEWLFGTPEGIQMFNRFSPEQQAALTEARNSALQQLRNPYEGFEPIRQEALRSFFQDIVPQLQNQFSASGQNSISSPVLQTNLSSAGANLSSMLAAQQSNYGMQNKRTALQQLGIGLTPMYDRVQSPGTQGVFGATAPYLAKGAIGGASEYFNADPQTRNFGTFRNAALKALAGGTQ